MDTATDDFRERFHLKAPQALMTAAELAQLLCATTGAIRQMAHRGQLPPTAFPGKRRAVWFVGDIRQWLEGVASHRSGAAPVACVQDGENSPPAKRVGRPSLPVDLPE